MALGLKNLPISVEEFRLNNNDFGHETNDASATNVVLYATYFASLVLLDTDAGLALLELRLTGDPRTRD